MSENSMGHVKVKPPFPNLVIFNVTALILSFVGYDYEVNDMM